MATAMYERKNRVSTPKQYKLIELFLSASTARVAGQMIKIINVQINASVALFMHLSQPIANKLPSYELLGEIER